MNVEQTSAEETALLEAFDASVKEVKHLEAVANKKLLHYHKLYNAHVKNGKYRNKVDQALKAYKAMRKEIQKATLLKEEAFKTYNNFLNNKESKV